MSLRDSFYNGDDYDIGTEDPDFWYLSSSLSPATQMMCSVLGSIASKHYNVPPDQWVYTVDLAANQSITIIFEYNGNHACKELKNFLSELKDICRDSIQDHSRYHFPKDLLFEAPDKMSLYRLIAALHDDIEREAGDPDNRVIMKSDSRLTEDWPSEEIPITLIYEMICHEDGIRPRPSGFVFGGMN